MSKSQIINIFWRWGRFCWTTRYLHTRKVTKSHSIFLFPSKTRASFNGGILPTPFLSSCLEKKWFLEALTYHPPQHMIQLYGSARKMYITETSYQRLINRSLEKYTDKLHEYVHRIPAQTELHVPNLPLIHACPPQAHGICL